MADYAPPTGPPPPKVPEGWIAQWNDQYKEWFYVNKYTKKSQWDKPTEPIYPPPGSEPEVPPSYDHNTAKPVLAEKTGLSSNNPYGPGGPGGAGSSHQDMSEDERLARQMQDEENARARAGAADSYYGAQGGPGQQQQNYGSELPPRPGDESSRGKGKGFLGKLLGKSGSKPQYGQQYPQQQQQQYYQQPPPGQYGGYPQQGYYSQPGYGPPQQAYGGRRPGGGGLGAGGAAALGLGGGLVGGMLIGEAIDGGDGGGDGGGDDGGDFGGDDGGGGGDFGGGDF